MGIKLNMRLLLFTISRKQSKHTRKQNPNFVTSFLFSFSNQRCPLFFFFHFLLLERRLHRPFFFLPLDGWTRSTLSLSLISARSRSPRLSAPLPTSLCRSLSLFRQCHIWYRRYVQHCVLLAFVDTHEILREQGDFETFIFILILSVWFFIGHGHVCVMIFGVSNSLFGRVFVCSVVRL
jgi:hypothetical protein